MTVDAKTLAKMIAEHEDQWDVADALWEDYAPADQFPDKGDANNGLYNRLREVVIDLEKEYGLTYKVDTLRRTRATAKAWPRGTRVPRAPFTVHRELRGTNGPNEMAILLRHHDGPITKMDVRRLRADNRAPDGRTWRDRLAQRLESTVRSALLGGLVPNRQDWLLTQGLDNRARDDAADVLDALARKVRT